MEPMIEMGLKQLLEEFFKAVTLDDDVKGEVK